MVASPIKVVAGFIRGLVNAASQPYPKNHTGHLD